MLPVYSQFGQFLGWFSNNILYGVGGANVVMVRGAKVFVSGEYIGTLRYLRGRLILQK